MGLVDTLIRGMLLTKQLVPERRAEVRGLRGCKLVVGSYLSGAFPKLRSSQAYLLRRFARFPRWGMGRQ